MWVISPYQEAGLDKVWKKEWGYIIVIHEG